MRLTYKLALALVIAAASLLVIPTTARGDQIDNRADLAWVGRSWVRPYTPYSRPYYRPNYQPYYRPYYQPYNNYRPYYRPYNYNYGAPRHWYYWG